MRVHVTPCFDCHDDGNLTFAVHSFDRRGKWVSSAMHRTKDEAMKIARRCRRKHAKADKAAVKDSDEG